MAVELGGGEKEVSNCINCEGVGSFTCTTCQGSGIQPRYLDRRCDDSCIWIIFGLSVCMKLTHLCIFCCPSENSKTMTDRGLLYIAKKSK